jgi:hypothetical protein
MASDDDGGGGGAFGWGLLVGLALGVVAGAFLASGPGRQQVDKVRARTIELTDSARRAAGDPESPLGRAINDGITAARRKRQELEQATRSESGRESASDA